MREKIFLANILKSPSATSSSNEQNKQKLVRPFQQKSTPINPEKPLRLVQFK